jgi:hypothetical protein
VRGRMACRARRFVLPCCASATVATSQRLVSFTKTSRPFHVPAIYEEASEKTYGSVGGLPAPPPDGRPHWTPARRRDPKTTDGKIVVSHSEVLDACLTRRPYLLTEGGRLWARREISILVAGVVSQLEGGVSCLTVSLRSY